MTPFEKGLYYATYGAAFVANPSAPAAEKIAARAVIGFRLQVAGESAGLMMPVAEGNVTPPVIEDDSE